MKKIIVFITVITLATSIFAQKEQSKHEVSIWGAYGLSTLNYDLTNGTDKVGLGLLGGLGYNYFLNYHWSIGIGAEFQTLGSSLNVKNFADYYYLPGVTTGPGYPLTSVAGNVSQDYSVFYVNVPLQVKYQVDAFKDHKWYAAANLKFGIPVKGTYSATGNYTALWRDNSVGQDWIQESKKDVVLDKKDNKFDTRFSPALGLETGIKWKLSSKLSLYTGIYADYGLFDVRKGDVDLNVGVFSKTANNAALSEVEHNSVLASSYTNEEDALTGKYANGKTAFTDKVNTLDAGIKVQLAFGFGGTHAKKANKAEQEKAERAALAEKNKPVSAKEIDDIVTKNTDRVIAAGKENVKDLKDFINDRFKQETQEVAEGLRLETIWGFDLDKTVIKKGTMQTIAESNLQTLLKNPEIRVNLVGNTDDFASDAYNQDLGTRRAQAVKDWLVSKGVDGSRLVISSNGKKVPFVANIDEANRRYNRRVEFLIIK